MHLTEILAPVFAQVPSLDDEELSDSHDTDFEIEDDIARKGFDQNLLNDLAQDFGLSKKASELLASSLVGWLVGFYGIWTFVGYLTLNRFLCK